MTIPGSVVIVGAGHPGFQLAVLLRQADYGGRVLLVNDEQHLLYKRPPLSKTYLKGPGGVGAVISRPLEFFVDQKIELIHEHVIGIDRSARHIEFASGRALEHGHLVLATGARNRSLAVPNAAVEGRELSAVSGRN